MHQLVDPRLADNIQDFWVDTCDILTETYTTSASGERIHSSYTAFKASVPCRLGPLIEVRPTDDKLKGADIESQHQNRQCKLKGFHSDITTEMFCRVQGIVFPIRGVESDSQYWSTRLKLEVIKPNG